MRRFSLLSGMVAVVIAAAALSGCAKSEVQSVSCAAYVQYDSLAAAAVDADLLARARITHDENPLEIELVDVIKGSPSVGDVINIVAPSTCDPVSAPEGTKDVMVLLVRHDNKEWAAINPDQGLLAFSSSQFASLR